MPILISCPSCGSKLRVGDDLAGKKVRCPKCAGVVPVSVAGSPEPPAAPRPVKQAPAPEPQAAAKVSAPEPFDAIEIVRAVAEKHGARGVLKKLGKLNPKHIANARAGFAKAMTDEEVPLVLLDRSFWGNGKAGMLLTNRQLYSSSHGRPIPLLEIRTATFEKPTLSEQMFQHKRPEASLLVNGTAVYTGPAKFELWVELLPELGQALREAIGSPEEDAPTSASVPAGAKGSSSAGPDLPRIAATAVCSGQGETEIVAMLADTGMDGDKARSMIEQMNTIRQQSRSRLPALGALLAGLIVTPIGIMGAAFVNVAPGRRPEFVGKLIDFLASVASLRVLDGAMKGLAAAGLILFCTGAYRLIRGNPPPKTEELLATWRARHVSDSRSYC